MKFNISSVSCDEEIHLAELRLYTLVEADRKTYFGKTLWYQNFMVSFSEGVIEKSSQLTNKQANNQTAMRIEPLWQMLRSYSGAVFTDVSGLNKVLGLRVVLTLGPLSHLRFILNLNAHVI